MLCYELLWWLTSQNAPDLSVHLEVLSMTRFLPVESGLLSPSSDFFIHTMGYSFPFSTLHTRLTVLPAQHRGRWGSWSLQTVVGLLTQVRDHLGPGDELDGGPLRLGLGGQQGRG